MEVCTRVPFNYTRGPFRPPLFINYSEHSLASHHITISVTSFENGVSRRSGWEARSKAPPSLSHSRNMCMVMALLLRYAAPLPPAPHHDHASHPFPQPSPTLPHTRSFPLPPTYLPCHHPPFPGWGTLVAAAPPPRPHRPPQRQRPPRPVPPPRPRLARRTGGAPRRARPGQQRRGWRKRHTPRRRRSVVRGAAPAGGRPPPVASAYAAPPGGRPALPRRCQ